MCDKRKSIDLFIEARLKVYSKAGCLEDQRRTRFQALEWLFLRQKTNTHMKSLLFAY